MPILDLLLDRAISFIPVLLCLTVHEWAHAWTAWRLGDDTAKMLGRVSLNPMAHIDPVGTLLLPLLGVPFGWAKPVPVNPLRFRPEISMPIGMLLTAAAGPIANLILAVIALTALAGWMASFSPLVNNTMDAGAGMSFGLGVGRDSFAAGFRFLLFLIHLNVVLACFNLLPIPPLDGSRIADAIMPTSLRPYWNQFTQLGPLLLIVVILMPNLIGFSILSWPVHWANQLVGFVVSRFAM